MDLALTSDDRPALSGEELRALIQKSDLRSWFDILLTYVMIVGLFALLTRWFNPVTFIIVFVLIGAIQHRISILLHEALHYLLLKNRFLNDIIANFFLAYPIGFTIHYRKIHFAHHTELGEDDDPDLVNYKSYPNTAAFFFAMFAQNITGFSAIRQFFVMLGLAKATDPHLLAAKIPRPSRWHIVGLVFVQLTIFLLLALFSRWWFYPLLWLAPLVTVAKTCSNVRNAVEHTAIVPDPHAPFARYRTILSPPFERFFLSPLNFHFHAEHHLYPAIPYHRLPSVHQILRAQPSYQRHIQLVPSYMHFVRKYMIKPKGAAL